MSEGVFAMSNNLVEGIRYAAGEVDKLAAHFVGNTNTDGTRDAAVYEQGIGCERASKMLRELANIMTRGSDPTAEYLHLSPSVHNALVRRIEVLESSMRLLAERCEYKNPYSKPG